MAARVKYIIALLALHTQPYTETAKKHFSENAERYPGERQLAPYHHLSGLTL